jgi:hypothetical protein
MTMKIAGRVVGGLHQRPEYNIDISKPELEPSVTSHFSRAKSVLNSGCTCPASVAGSSPSGQTALKSRWI